MAISLDHPINFMFDSRVDSMERLDLLLVGPNSRGGRHHFGKFWMSISQTLEWVIWSTFVN